MPHDHHHHHHGHHHHHHHAGQRIGFAFWLNFIFAIIELVGGLYVNSVSIMSDALHDFGDALSLAVAWFLERKSQQGKNEKYSYGYRRFSTISALLTAMILIVGSAMILVESVPRVFNPVQPETKGMIALAILGVLVNGAAVVKMKAGKSLNERTLTWHFVEDLLGWGLILVSALVMNFVYFPALDSIVAILISIFVIRNVWKSLQEAMGIFLQATPQNIEVQKIQNYFQTLDELNGFHHLHVWTLDGENHILTAHLVTKADLTKEQVAVLKTKIKQQLTEKFHIHEATLEIEYAGEICHDPQHQ